MKHQQPELMGRAVDPVRTFAFSSSRAKIWRPLFLFCVFGLFGATMRYVCSQIHSSDRQSACADSQIGFFFHVLLLSEAHETRASSTEGQIDDITQQQRAASGQVQVLQR